MQDVQQRARQLAPTNELTIPSGILAVQAEAEDEDLEDGVGQAATPAERAVNEDDLRKEMDTYMEGVSDDILGKMQLDEVEELDFVKMCYTAPGCVELYMCLVVKVLQYSGSEIQLSKFCRYSLPLHVFAMRHREFKIKKIFPKIWIFYIY